MTNNAERKRRGLTTDARCPNCDELNEDDDHCIRKCVKTAEIWEVFLHQGALTSFFNMEFDHQITFNVTGKKTIDTADNWGDSFALVAWWIWKQRCKKAFNDEEWDRNTKICWLRKTLEKTGRAFTKRNLAGHSRRNIEKLAQPQDGWSTMQVDASFTSSHLPTGCGVVLWDAKGNWLREFSCTTKANNAMEGEL